ncbi:hypothetical protein BX666DRAFT_1853000 [Dichotomocladium elegans]|nr:hypothetical protein BX666DRAFT_1853000 [Dichotomocladium elegans]
MSSVSSHDGSEKDGNHFSRLDGFPHRYAALRKTDLLDTLDIRHRDTDTWSVAATIDDQESVISGAGGTASIISSSRATAEGGRESDDDDDRSTLDGTLRDLDGSHDNASTDDDKRSRSNAAEFGDEGTRSAATDFDQSDTSDDEANGQHHRVVNDDISAPPQPQPSFASDSKSFAELMEENEALHTQLRNLQIAQKHQSELIENLRSLTNCNEEVYDQALHLSQHQHQHQQHQPADPRSLTQQLARLTELVTRYVQTTVPDDAEARIKFEQELFAGIVELYFDSLPFGTENQQLLNLAYSDQMRRFQNTLGANFAKWYRRQTVQSLSLNPASKEYLHHLRDQMTDRFFRQQQHKQEWDDLLNQCATLSLIIHGGNADVAVQTIEPGSKYDPHTMAVAGEDQGDGSKTVKTIISPLFIDEDQVILLPARVILN